MLTSTRQSVADAREDALRDTCGEGEVEGCRIETWGWAAGAGAAC